MKFRSYLICVLLYRNVETDAFGNPPTLVRVRNAIYAKLSAQESMETPDDDEPAEEAPKNDINNKNSNNSFEDLLTKIAAKQTPAPLANNKDPIVTMLDEYSDAPVIPMTEDPLLFWKEYHESGNPLKQKFSEVAVEALTPPPSSVDVERLFSKASDVVPDKVNNLKPENLEKKLFCHNNLPKVDYEY